MRHQRYPIDQGNGLLTETVGSMQQRPTDRAFRIGQKRNVLVHKFVCAGTVEEKIDAMIESKKSLSEEVLGGSAEMNLTEMTDDALLRLVALDLASVSKE
ncbi:DEAD/DEAH box helicase [Roseinatronobacter monicus]|uniref:DEAD/DEAH box helicase n=1 Tax=Roseinatronobacter monicus TaxID=393481 RepID=UPI001BA6AE27|nr:DEAD/DEAH box helicase [Roseinatronobacter monicus]